MPTRSRAATVSAAAGPNRRRGSFTADRTDDVHNLFDRHALDKRVSRDDLSLALKSSRKANNVTAFHVPIHFRPPSPDTSPRSSSLTRMTMVRTSTPDSIGDSSETGVIAIGMAIGSPTQVGEFTPIAAWNPQRTNTAAAEIPEPAPEPVDDTQQKTRKWGIFRSKSKRAARPTQPQRSMTDTPNVSTTSLASGGTVHDQRKTPKHTPIVIRSQTEPVPNEPEVPPPPPIPADLKTPTDLKPLSPGKLIKERPTGIERKPSKEVKKESSSSGGIGRKMSLRALRGDSARRRAEKAAAAAPPPPSPPPVPPMPQLASSLLDIEIPSIKMERYSVMFNGVLQTQATTSSASSLLARRHATLDRLQTIGDGVAEGYDDHSRPRRATSPQPSPTIVVDSDTSKPLPSPRHRAHTSPALISPVQAAFQDEVQETAQARIVQVPKPSQNAPKLVSKFSVRRAASSPNRRNGLTPTRGTSPVLISPTARSKAPSPFTPDTSSLILDSPAHTDDEASEARFVRGHPQLSPSEPSWSMVSPPASITSTSPETSKKLSPPSSLASPDKITVIRPPSESNPEDALRNAVEISIARQISVSHQQRKMLHPLKSNPSVRRRGDSNPMAPAGAYIPIEKNERLAETKTATPVLGELAHSPETWQMHRKSERVILEGP
ncbi:hypothetical protein Neosp_002311 [[Neocosmospora] mangrovei]